MKPEGGAGTAVKTARRIHGFLVILERAAGAAAKAAAATAAMAVAALLLVTASCATLPREAAAPDPLILLPPGKSVYGSLNVPDNREIAEALIGTVVSDPKLRASFLDRTNRVFIGGDLAGPEGTSLLLIAEGTYPRSLVSIGLAGSGDWRREKGKPDIWVKRPSDTAADCAASNGGSDDGTDAELPGAADNDAGSVSISLPWNGILLVAIGDISLRDIISAGTQQPPQPEAPHEVSPGAPLEAQPGMLPEAGEFSPDERALLLGGDMVLFSDRIPDFVAPLLGIDPSVIRMERFRMYLDRVSEQQYRADADIGMASVREAKALNTIVRLAVLAERKRSEIAGKPGLLSEAEVTFVDSDVLIHGIILDLNTLTGLLAGLGNMSGNGGGNR